MEISIVKAEHLLERVAALKKASVKKALETGRDFNIFSILGAEGRETSTHSAFLAELLNKKGSHGQGVTFLKLFIKTLEDDRLMGIPSIDSNSSQVRKEKYIGKVNHEVGEGGRIDIYISDRSGNAICIENKIYAKDQHQQLGRYSDYLEEKHIVNSLLLYLTLYGSEPSEASIRHKGEVLEAGKDYHCISYQKHILNWLVECHKAAIYVPIVREAIDQYIHLIKKLTNQSMAKEEKKELVALVVEHPEKFFTLNEARNAFFEDVNNKLQELQRELNLDEFTRSGKGEIWDKEDQKNKLQYTLVIGLNQIGNANKLQLKVRLSPLGWEIFLWNTQGLQDEKTGLLSTLTYEWGEGGQREKFVNLTASILDSNMGVKKDENEGDQFVPYKTDIGQLTSAIEKKVMEIYESYPRNEG